MEWNGIRKAPKIYLDSKYLEYEEDWKEKYKNIDVVYEDIYKELDKKNVFTS